MPRPIGCYWRWEKLPDKRVLVSNVQSTNACGVVSWRRSNFWYWKNVKNKNKKCEWKVIFVTKIDFRTKSFARTTMTYLWAVEIRLWRQMEVSKRNEGEQQSQTCLFLLLLLLLLLFQCPCANSVKEREQVRKLRTCSGYVDSVENN
jgi:hypothetical protein